MSPLWLQIYLKHHFKVLLMAIYFTILGQVLVMVRHDLPG